MLDQVGEPRGNTHGGRNDRARSTFHTQHVTGSYHTWRRRILSRPSGRTHNQTAARRSHLEKLLDLQLMTTNRTRVVGIQPPVQAVAMKQMLLGTGHLQHRLCQRFETDGARNRSIFRITLDMAHLHLHECTNGFWWSRAEVLGQGHPENANDSHLMTSNRGPVCGDDCLATLRQCPFTTTSVAPFSIVLSNAVFQCL